MKYYEILDVQPDATQEQIKNAYRILVQLHHPDRLQQVPPNVRLYAEERLKKINEAYQVLGDPERRARYDATQARSRPEPDYAGADYSYADAEGGYGYGSVWDEAWEQSRRRYRRRYKTPEEEAAEAAYEEWAHQEAERYAEQREAERARQAEREAREAEARARQAAAEQFPRARRQGDEVIVHFAPGVWTTFVRVPAGEFLMGSDPARDVEAGRSEQPAHTVSVSEFFIGKFPVTNEQFRAFRAAHYSAPGPLADGKANHPVGDVTWDDAMAFAQWLSRTTARTFRLPTEAEWEKAARWTDGRLYPWGDVWDPGRLNIEGVFGGTTPVDRFSPVGDSPYGVADMSGNVWEWCADWFDPQTYARLARGVARDPQGPATGPGYVARGGAFDSPPKHARCAHRNWFYPEERRANLGFRLVVMPF